MLSYMTLRRIPGTNWSGLRFSTWTFIDDHTLCVRATSALSRLSVCEGSSEPSCADPEGGQGVTTPSEKSQN